MKEKNPKSNLIFGSFPRVLFAIWMIIAVAMNLILSTDLATKIKVLAIFISGASTILFWIAKKPIQKFLLKTKLSLKQKFVLLGSLGAIWVEFEFWFLGIIIFKVPIAAHENFLIDLLVTMPWYILMMFLLWGVQKKNSYSYYAIFVLGGIYDFCNDGLFGTILQVGTVPIGTLILLVIVIPLFAINYSFMVLPASYILKSDESYSPRKGKLPKIFVWILPILGLIVLGSSIYFSIMFLDPSMILFISGAWLIILLIMFFKSKNKNTNL